MEVTRKRETSAQADHQHFQKIRSPWFWQHGGTDLITCFPLRNIGNTCISWPLMLSLVNKGLFCTVRAGKNKKTKIHPLQFPMNVIVATVRFPILWIYKTQVTVKSVKTKTTRSRGLVVFARFFNCTLIFTPWSEVWAEQLCSYLNQKYSQIWQGGFCFILCHRAANFLSGKTLGRGSFCCGFSLCAIRLDFRADWEGHLLIVLVSSGHYIKRKISFNVSWDKA